MMCCCLAALPALQRVSAAAGIKSPQDEETGTAIQGVVQELDEAAQEIQEVREEDMCMHACWSQRHVPCRCASHAIQVSRVTTGTGRPCTVWVWVVGAGGQAVSASPCVRVLAMCSSVIPPCTHMCCNTTQHPQDSVTKAVEEVKAAAARLDAANQAATSTQGTNLQRIGSGRHAGTMDRKSPTMGRT